MKTNLRMMFSVIAGMLAIVLSAGPGTAAYVTNGGFESDKTGWAQWQPEPEVVATVLSNAGQAREGSKFMEVAFSNTATYVTLVQDVDIAASGLAGLSNGAPLKYSAWYRADVAGNETARLAAVYDPDGAAHGWTDNGGAAGDQPAWTQQSLNMILDNAASVLRLLLNVNETTLAGAAGKVWWDDVKIELDPSYNYLSNPSFEDDKTGWGQWEPEPIVVVSIVEDAGQAHHGSKLAKMDYLGTALYVTMVNDVSVSGSGLAGLPNNSPLKFTAWYKANVAGPDNIRLAAVYDPDTNPHGWADNGGVAGNQPVWTQQSHSLALDNTATNLRVLLNVSETTVSGDGTVWWDDAKIQVNTERTYLTNGSFENGKLGWQQWSPEPDVVVTVLEDPVGAKDGDKYARGAFAGTTPFATLNQDINMSSAGLVELATGTPLYLTAWYKADVASNEVGRLIHFYDVASNPRGFGNAGMAGDVGAWQQQVLPFFMDSTAQDLRILLNVDETTLTADGTVWWDDVELSLTDPNITTPTPTPPPSAIRNWTLY